MAYIVLNVGLFAVRHYVVVSS